MTLGSRKQLTGSRGQWLQLVKIDRRGWRVVGESSEESREQELPLLKALAHSQHMNKEALLLEKWLVSQHEACI